MQTWNSPDRLYQLLAYQLNPIRAVTEFYLALSSGSISNVKNFYHARRCQCVAMCRFWRFRCPRFETEAHRRHACGVSNRGAISFLSRTGPYRGWSCAVAFSRLQTGGIVRLADACRHCLVFRQSLRAEPDRNTWTRRDNATGRRRIPERLGFARLWRVDWEINSHNHQAIFVIPISL